jgi:hypothetical protein
MTGAKLELKLPLPGGPLCVRSDVVFSNVPGNLRRPNLPIGMGVRFRPLPEGDAKTLRDYIEAKLSQICV